MRRRLEASDIDHRFFEVDGPAVSHDDLVALDLDVDPEWDCKTLITEDDDGHAYAFMLRGKRRMDFRRAREVVGRKLRIVGPDRLAEVTGLVPGSVCPILLDIQLFVDAEVLEGTRIHFGSGDPGFGLELHASDLEKVMRFEVVNVAKSKNLD